MRGIGKSGRHFSSTRIFALNDLHVDEVVPIVDACVWRLSDFARCSLKRMVREGRSLKETAAVLDRSTDDVQRNPPAAAALQC
ncbi:MAG: hypothetical protein QOI40_2501 [Alphaproteobacteria bacterium]|nr:hypothetical protein [Alphaproteobacteria bacterium]